MVEQFSIGHHSGILEVFTKTSSDEMYVYPGDVGRGEDCRVEQLRVF